ncbi:hypothetical protein [Thalassobaculum sp.]|uniref:YfhO family protein n=1 Tax=Thalassobaculum sp. TaxID=2022740 RepID=UPI0032EB398D
MILADRPRLREAMIALAAITAAWVVLAWPWLVGGLTIPWDAKIHFLAMLRWLAEHLAQGDWPLWMPESFGGRPALGDPQSMILSPGFLLLAALDPEPSARAGDAVVLIELLIGGLAAALFGLRRGWHPAAAVLAALVMMVGASASARLQHTLLVQSHAFIPVVLLALDAALDRPTIRRGLLAGLAVGMLVIGRDQVAFLGLIALFAFVVARVSAASDRAGFVKERLLVGLLAVSVAVLLAAVPVLATLEFAEVSNRPSFAFAFGAKQSIPPESLLTMLIPNLFGGVSSHTTYWGPGSALWSPQLPVDRTIVQLYVGMIPIVLVLWIGLLRGRLLKGEGRLPLALAAFFAIYALGHYTPIFEVLFDHVPGVDRFRRPADATFLLGATLALSAGWLCDRVLRDGLPVVAGWRRGVEAAIAMALLAAGAGVAHSQGRLIQTLPALGTTAAMAIAAVVVVAWAVRSGRTAVPARRTAAVAALLLLTLIDLRIFTVGTPLNAMSIKPFTVLDDPEDVPLAAWLECEVSEIELYEGPVRVEVLGLGGAWQNLPMSIGVEDTLGYNPLRLAEYDKAVGSEQNSHTLERRFGTLMTGYRSDFADLLGVRIIVLGGPMEEVDPASASAFGPALRFRGSWVYENPRTVPRVLFIGREGARRYDPETLIEQGGLPRLDWRREALIDPLPEPPIQPAQVRGRAGFVRMLERTSDRVDLEVSAQRPGFVVLHDIGYPGWVAYVDGERQEPRRANALFMAASLSAGKHRVQFIYEPLSVEHLWAMLVGDAR